MRFSSRLIFCSAAPAALFVLALLSSQWGLTRTQSDFNDYLRNNQAVVAQLQELYAKGLQSGQALRNIVMLIGTIVDELERQGKRYGLVTMCAAGGMAPAIIVERV